MRNEPSYRDTGRCRLPAVASHVARSPALCASIAHEMRQPLAAIIANANACRHWLGASPPNQERVQVTIERILEDAVSASETIAGLLALFAPGNAIHAPVQINDIIREACALVVDEDEATRVEIALELDPMLPVLALDRIQIRQLLINLIRNGIEAMETSPGRRRLEVFSHCHRSGARIEVSDRGNGVPDTKRMFDALFSTKKNGMGIGLALCRQIIEAHGGRLWAEPGQVQGTRMIFTLPDRRACIGTSPALGRQSPAGRSRDRGWGWALQRLAAMRVAVTGSARGLTMLISRRLSSRVASFAGEGHRSGAWPWPTLRLALRETAGLGQANHVKDADRMNACIASRKRLASRCDGSHAADEQSPTARALSFGRPLIRRQANYES